MAVIIRFWVQTTTKLKLAFTEWGRWQESRLERADTQVEISSRQLSVRVQSSSKGNHLFKELKIT